MIQFYEGPCVRALAFSDGIVELCFDRRDDAVNKLDTAALADLAGAIKALECRPDVRGLLISSSKSGFVAGADIDLLLPVISRAEEEIRAYLRPGQEVVATLANLEIPTVTAINGFAMGGGLEIALATDYRILSTGSQVGLPEVGLGIIPGMGGTARLPRLSGSKVALDWVVGARSHRADVALQAGVVDAVADSAKLREAALTLLGDALAGKFDWRARRAERQGPFVLDSEAVGRAREQARRAGPHLPAATIAVDLLAAASHVGLEDAIELELNAFGRAAHTPAAGALMVQFINNQKLRKSGRSAAKDAHPVKRIAVIGAGIMGGGIACASALHGVPSLLKDIAPGSLESGLNEARRLLTRQASQGLLSQNDAEAMLDSITPTLTTEGFGDVDLVIEAVIEKMDVKQNLFREIEAVTRPGSVLASNTSSLSIGEMSEALARPRDFVGMHFFNPVPLMPLVEIIRGPESSREAIATAVSYVLTLGKIPLIVKDCPGFLVNRLLGAYLFGFMQLVHDGADFAEVDRVMEAFGWPMGPAYLQDVVGIDTLDKALAGIAAGYARMQQPFESAVHLLSGLGRYGQKNGAGYYRYETDQGGKLQRKVDPETHRLLESVQREQGAAFSDEEIVKRMMLPMVIEAALCLDENVAAGVEDIDAAMALGAGFPRHLCGPLWYADRLGLSEVISWATRYKGLGGLYIPGNDLKDRAATGRCFYPQAC